MRRLRRKSNLKNFRFSSKYVALLDVGTFKKLILNALRLQIAKEPQKEPFLAAIVSKFIKNKLGD